MAELKGEIKDSMVGYMASNRIGQQKLAKAIGMGAEVVNDLVNMKRLPRPHELERLDKFFSKGGAWVRRMVEHKRAGRQRRDEHGGRIIRYRTAHGPQKMVAYTLDQMAKRYDGKANG